MNEFNVAYAQLAGALRDETQRDQARADIVQLITPIVRTYLWERHGSTLKGFDAAHDAESDGVIAVLGMLDVYDPDKGELQHYLMARNAAWRRAVDASARTTDHAVKFSDGERRVLALAYKIKNDYENTHPGRNLDGDAWVAAVREYLTTEESSDTDRAAYNTRKGITAAAKNLPELLAAWQTPVHPDAEPSLWSHVDVQVDEEEDGDVWGLGGVSEDKPLTAASKRDAAARLGSGHGQFAYLSGATLVREQ